MLFLSQDKYFIFHFYDTLGIVEYRGVIQWKRRETITIVDVGGQRTERKKWLHCFDCVDSVIFVAALSTYDQVTSDFPKENLMLESLRLFSAICNSRWFASTPMLLFLNKKDVFYEKIVYSPITKCFPEYSEVEEDFDLAARYIQQQFRKQNRQKRDVYCHFTNAKDSQNITVVCGILVDIIQKALMADIRSTVF